MLTFGELFAGIGGISLGFERAGMIPKWHVELDDYATIILEKHWPHVARYRDVRECGKHNLEPVDVIAGGFPCQDVSLAGKRQGLEGERTTLWGEFARIIGELRPRWVVAENVPGLLSSDDGRFFGNVLRDLAALGYDAEWDCIPAAAVGAPHIRYRVFVVAYPTCVRRDVLAQSPGEQNVCPSEAAGHVKAERCTDRELVTMAPRYCLERLWAPQPGVQRVVDGVPHVVDRLRCLGNAVVPQVAEYIGRLIVEAS